MPEVGGSIQVSYQMAHCFITGKCYNIIFYGFTALTKLHLDLHSPLGFKKILSPL